MAAPKATLPEQPLPDPIPIKTATGPSLTGTSKISYKVAIDSTSQINNASKTNHSSILYFQILKNSNTGKFSEEWIAYNDAKSAFPIGPFSSAPLRKLYRHKPLNTSGFLLAALLNEDIVEREPGKQLLFRFKSDKEFLAEMERLATYSTGAPDASTGDKSSSRGKKCPRKGGQRKLNENNETVHYLR
jgi:hypothetical protein